MRKGSSKDLARLQVNDPHFLPVIKPAGWRGREGAVCRPLADIHTAHMPLVTFAWDLADHRIFLTESLLAELETDLAAVDRQACHNLRRQAGTDFWHIRSFAYDGDELEVLFREAEHAATALLLPSLLEEAHRRLGSEELIFTAPSSCQLYAWNPELEPLARGLTAMQYGESVMEGTEPISGQLFLFMEGRLEAITEPLPGAAADAEPGSEASLVHQDWDLNPDTGELCITLDCRDLAEFVEQLDYHMSAVTSALPNLAGFSGQVRVVAVGVTNSEEIAEVFASLEAASQAISQRQRLRTMTGQPLRVRLRPEFSGGDKPRPYKG